MTRVLLVDDHRVVLAGITGLLAGTPDLQVVGTAATGEEAVEVATRTRPDVVVMDLSMPGVGGVVATRELLAVVPTAAVLVLTSFSDRDRVVEAVRAGAVGYLLKDAEPEELVRGIRAAAQGQSPLDPRVAREVLRRGLAPDPRAGITERERDVLLLVTEGLANKQIARRLGIREGTVKAHLGSAFQRIGVTDRTSAALWARRHLVDV